MLEKTQLEVGDKLYQNHYSTYSGPYVIERVTATQAISGRYRFRREISSYGSVKAVGEGGGSYYLETPAILLKWKQQTLRSKLRSFDYSKLTLDQLERLNAVISETHELVTTNF